MHVSQLSRAAARQCRKRPQPELEQAVSDIYPRLIRTEAGDPHETPAQRPPRRSRETPLLSRPGPDYRPRKSAGRMWVVLPALLTRFYGDAGVGSGAWVP